MIKSRDIPKVRLTDPTPLPPEARLAAETAFEYAIDRRNPFWRRVKAFIRGETKAGRTVGAIADIATIFLPGGVRTGREALQTIIQRKRKTMSQDEKPFIKKLSTWEGIASLAGAVGIFIDPEAAAQIVAGLFAVFGGIYMWRAKAQKE